MAGVSVAARPPPLRSGEEPGGSASGGHAWRGQGAAGEWPDGAVVEDWEVQRGPQRGRVWSWAG
jgi:hypothetical protein